MRTYLTSHPWLTFSTYLPDLPHDLWLNLGIAQSKCEEVGRAILTPERRSILKKLYLSRGTQATVAIEGNTLTEEEVGSVLENHSDLPSSKKYLVQEVLNIRKAIEIVHKYGSDFNKWSTDGTLSYTESASVVLSDSIIKSFNKALLNNISLSDKRIIPGEIFLHATKVGNYIGAPVEERDYLLEKLCTWIAKDFEAPLPQHQITYSIISAILAHLYLAWIHPFGDGNGRTARMFEFLILYSSGIPEIAAHLLSNHYNQTRAEYYHELDHGRKTKEVHHFLRYAIEGFIEQLNEQLATLNEYQLEAAWRDYIYRVFDDKSNSKVSTRQRQVALDLWNRQKEVLVLSDIRHLSPKVAEHYAGMSENTIIRDVKALEKMQMILKKGSHIQGNFGLLSGL